MSARGKMHDWRSETIWGEDVARCRRCGLIGTPETYRVGSGIGWRAKPTFGCKDTPTNV